MIVERCGIHGVVLAGPTAVTDHLVGLDDEGIELASLENMAQIEVLSHLSLDGTVIEWFLNASKWVVKQ